MATCSVLTPAPSKPNAQRYASVQTCAAAVVVANRVNHVTRTPQMVAVNGMAVAVKIKAKAPAKTNPPPKAVANQAAVSLANHVAATRQPLRDQHRSHAQALIAPRTSSVMTTWTTSVTAPTTSAQTRTSSKTVVAVRPPAVQARAMGLVRHRVVKTAKAIKVDVRPLTAAALVVAALAVVKHVTVVLVVVVNHAAAALAVTHRAVSHSDKSRQ